MLTHRLERGPQLGEVVLELSAKQNVWGEQPGSQAGSRAWQHTMLVLLNLVKNQVAEPWFLAAALTSLRFLPLRYLSILS